MLRLNNGETNKRLPRAARAFTLVELLVVMVLMAIIIGISVPAFVGMGRGAGMRGAVRSVHSSLSLVRQWAITHREQVTFVYCNGDNAESYFYATNEFNTAIISTNEPTTLPLDVIFYFSSGTNDYITFKSDGGLLDDGHLVDGQKIVNIRDRKFKTEEAKGKKISINGLTGAIRVE
ncbi:MAG: prepilin-type N-terminal cleavage/methylation domain-containing protein [Kiritimatiellae bacterium]|nr:prepilin-type N-terminal cleavage/methylation domain-containing protein [Kiritimatiellia bacterium]